MNLNRIIFNAELSTKKIVIIQNHCNTLFAVPAKLMRRAVSQFRHDFSLDMLYWAGHTYFNEDNMKFDTIISFQVYLCITFLRRLF